MGTGNFPTAGADYSALTDSGGGTFTALPTFLADAAGPIGAAAVASDKVGNLSGVATASAVGLDPTSLTCQPASVTSGRTATLWLGTLVNTTPDPDSPVAGEPVLVEILNGSDTLVFSDMVTTDGNGKVIVSNTFNLAHGPDKVMLYQEGEE